METCTLYLNTACGFSSESFEIRHPVNCYFKELSNKVSPFCKLLQAFASVAMQVWPWYLFLAFWLLWKPERGIRPRSLRGRRRWARPGRTPPLQREKRIKKGRIEKRFKLLYKRNCASTKNFAAHMIHECHFSFLLFFMHDN